MSVGISLYDRADAYFWPDVLLHRTDLRFRRAFIAAFIVPSAVPPFIWAMGWVALASPRAGYLNRALGEGTFNVYGLPWFADLRRPSQCSTTRGLISNKSI